MKAGGKITISTNMPRKEDSEGRWLRPRCHFSHRGTLRLTVWRWKKEAKLIFVGFLATHDDGQIYRGTFVPLAATVVPTESSDAISLCFDLATHLVQSVLQVDSLSTTTDVYIDGGVALGRAVRDLIGDKHIILRMAFPSFFKAFLGGHILLVKAFF